MLKQHLLSAYDTTPEDWRLKWGLPDDYPVVAPDYGARRRVFAKQIDLGSQTETAPAVTAILEEEAEIALGARVQVLPQRKRGCPRAVA